MSIADIPPDIRYPDGDDRDPGYDPRMFECPDCDGCGDYEGGETILTTCGTCNGSGIICDVCRQAYDAEGGCCDDFFAPK